MPTKSRLQTV